MVKIQRLALVLLASFLESYHTWGGLVLYAWWVPGVYIYACGSTIRLFSGVNCS